jgi:ATP-dependent DNA helicase RecQ
MQAETSHDSRLTTHEILKQYWGYDAFRPLQLEVINSVLDGKDTLALMPTGGGKSLCYQVPGLAKDGLCLVISPLIALMKDQVENLRKKNITAFAIYSGMKRTEVMNVLKVATNSNCKFLYVSPERLETSLFKEYLPGMDVNLIAVDEAHCISQWGYDFRPPYLRIAALREELPKVPVLALTASATPDVQEDIKNKLSGYEGKELREKWNIFRQSFARPNLSYSVFKVDSKFSKLVDILKKVTGCGIVYCKSRNRTKEIAELLKMHGISSDFYHAGLSSEERSRKQEEWMQDKTRIIASTNAFGMGIDKPNVRVIIHADAPDCLENYYQEAGRAGRDGRKAYAVLLFDENDVSDLEKSVDLRFPSMEQIRNVYQAVANYLQLSSGSGEGQYFDFDIGDFLKKFKIKTHVVVSSLKILEQDGWLNFNEQVFLPATIQFTTDKNYLYEFEKNHPHLEPLVKTLLRAYAGIFEHPIAISEIVITNLLKKQKDEIIKDLVELHNHRIINYQPQKDSPQIYFLRPRIKTEDLAIDLKALQNRKEKFIERTKNMIRYIRETGECRSKIIGNYFGDANLADCGVCDNCLNQKALHISKEEFETIHHRITDSIKKAPIHSKELLQQLTGIKKEKAWKVIDFLQAENKIELDNAGWIRLK